MPTHSNTYSPARLLYLRWPKHAWTVPPARNQVFKYPSIQGAQFMQTTTTFLCNNTPELPMLNYSSVLSDQLVDTITNILHLLVKTALSLNTVRWIVLRFLLWVRLCSIQVCVYFTYYKWQDFLLLRLNGIPLCICASLFFFKLLNHYWIQVSILLL